MPPFCKLHEMYHIDYAEHIRMCRATQRENRERQRREKAERIAAGIVDEYTERYANETRDSIELQLVRGVIEDAAAAAALAALNEKENAQ